MERLIKTLQQNLNKHPHLRWMNKRNQKGFTLVELVVNMAIIGIIMVMVTTITSISLKSFNNHKKNIDAVNVGNMILSTLENRIKTAGQAKLEPYFIPVAVKDSDGTFLYWDDLTGDGKPDETIRDKNKEEFPVCLDDIRNYQIFFLKPDKQTLTNLEKRALTGADRRGKLYTIKNDENIDFYKTNNQHENGYGIDGYIRDGDKKDIYVEPLLDEKLYKGYSVDVKFEYISVHRDPHKKGGTIVASLIPGEPTETGGDGSTTEGDGSTTGGDGSTTEGDGSTTGGDGSTETNPESTPETPEPVLPGQNEDGAPAGRLNCIKVIIDIYDGEKRVHTVSGTITFIQRYFNMVTPYSTYEGQKDVLMIRS